MLIKYLGNDWNINQGNFSKGLVNDAKAPLRGAEALKTDRGTSEAL